MKLTKTPDGYVIQVPGDVVTALGLREGDEVVVARPQLDEARKTALMARIADIAVPLPADYRFDREEANAR